MNRATRLEERWQKNLPMNLKELAEIQQVSYSTVVRWSQTEHFPRVGNMLKREDFEAWWKRTSRSSWKSEARKSRSGASRPPVQAQAASEEIASDPQQQRIAELKGERDLTERQIRAEDEKTRSLQAQALLCESAQLSGLPPKAAALMREACSWSPA